MTDLPNQKIVYISCTIVGVLLLAINWLVTDSIHSFFLMLFLLCMFILRWRAPKLGWTSVADVLACVVLAPAVAGVAFFSAMYYGMYFVFIAAVYLVFAVDVYAGVIAILAGGLGLCLRLWEQERDKRLHVRDSEANRYYQLESLQSGLISATKQIERMTAINERARISREIHDNAGHEIVAAYISLQTVRGLFDDADPEALTLYDAAMKRLDAGADKIRQAVHNLAPIATIGVEALQEICERFHKPIEFIAFGDTRHVPVHVWSVLESCLNECLTNIGKHASPAKIKVDLDTTRHIVRLCIENDGVSGTKKGLGTGLRNLRYRLTEIGGSLAVAQDKIFRVVCVVPIKKAEL